MSVFLKKSKPFYQLLLSGKFDRIDGANSTTDQIVGPVYVF
jgi:hypothetical protein